MPLVRIGGSAFDLEDVSAVVRDPCEGIVTVYLRDAVAVRLEGEDARAMLRWVESLPTFPAGPSGPRVVVSEPGFPEGGQPVGRKKRG